MIKSVTVTNYLGETLKMELARPEKSGFAITQIKGLGPQKSSINMTEISTSDGGTINSSRRNARNIVLTLDFSFYSYRYSSIEEARYDTYKYFPGGYDVDLEIETDFRVAKIRGRVEDNAPNIFAKQETAMISIICPDPNFYSAGEKGNNTVVFSGVEKVFEFPFENNSLTEPLIEFGSIENKTEQVVTYQGDAKIGVTITIHALGEAGTLTIYNTGTREIMRIDTNKLAEMTGAGITSGDEIVICTVRNQKGATLLRGGKEINILNCLGKPIQWFTLSKGDNIFAYTAEGGSSNLQFKIENKIIYEGM